MSTLDDTRRENIYLLMAYDGDSVTTLAKKATVSRSTLSTMLNGKEISDKYARRIERVFNKDAGWLDTEQIDQDVPAFDKDVTKIVFNKIYTTKRLLRLYESVGYEGKADLFSKLFILFNDPAARELSINTLLTIIDGDNKNEAKRGKATK